VTPSDSGFAAGDSLFRSLLESSPDAIVIFDKTGTIVLVNSHTERLFGYSRAELIGQPVDRLVPQRFRSQHAAHRNNYVAELRPGQSKRRKWASAWASSIPARLDTRTSRGLKLDQNAVGIGEEKI
jgi:PAS domain S-box-containing protein